MSGVELSAGLAEILPAGGPAGEVVGPDDRGVPDRFSPTPNFSGATTDARLVELWLKGKAPSTRRKYEEDLKSFLLYSGGKPLSAVTLSDLQEFSDDLSWLAPATQARKLRVMKSLFSFAQKVGYLAYNVGAALEAPKAKETLSERILSEEEIHRLINAPDNPRDRALLRTLYAGALRREEACGLKWRDVAARPDLGSGLGQLTVFGKGSKTGAVVLPASVFRDLLALRDRQARLSPGGSSVVGTASDEEPVFASRKRRNANGGHLDPSAVNRVVAKAAKKAGIGRPVSPHWLRHAHASHAHARGTDLALIRDTLRHSSISTTGRYLHARPNDSSALHLGF